MYISTPAPLSVRADAPLLARADPPPYTDMNAYYASVPSCARVCEQNYWSKYVNAAKCKGDGADFECFCHGAIMGAAAVNDSGMRGLCVTQSCRSDAEIEAAEVAVVGIAMYCALISYAGENSTSLGREKNGLAN